MASTIPILSLEQMQPSKSSPYGKLTCPHHCKYEEKLKPVREQASFFT
jgi:hypothetical protein